MTAATHDHLLPRAPGGLGPGAVLSLLVHLGLIAGLTVAVDWRTKAPEAVSAELWASLPQVAAPKAEEPAPPPPAPTPAPPPPAPPPVVKEAPPPPPDIAIERAAEKRKKELQAKKKLQARKEEAEKAKAAAEAERADKARREAAQAKAKAEDARLAKARDEQMKRMLGSLQGSGTSAGTAARDAGPSQSYIGRLSAILRNGVNFPDNGGPNPTVEVRVLATPTGTIISHKVIKKSGNDEFDDAVQRGLDRLGTLPRDSDGRVPTDIIIVHRLRDQ